MTATGLPSGSGADTVTDPSSAPDHEDPSPATPGAVASSIPTTTEVPAVTVESGSPTVAEPASTVDEGPSPGGSLDQPDTSDVPPIPASDTSASEAAQPVVRRRRASGGTPSNAPRRRRSRLIALQVGTSIVFIALVVGLAWVGYTASRRITAGENLDVRDPNEPNYVAEVKPTPVDLVAFTGPDNRLAAAAVVTAGAGGKGGTVVPIPADVASVGADGQVGVPMGAELDQGGIDQLRTAIGDELTFGFSGADVVSAETLASLANVAGPITIALPDNLTEADPNGGPDQVRYRAGDLTLQPAEVAPFLAFKGQGEPVSNQALRAQSLLEALLNGLKGKDLSSLSSSDSGDGGFVGLLPDLVAGDMVFDQVPLSETLLPDTGWKATVVDSKALPSFVGRVVPFPTSSSPGQRARVRLLNGTSDKEATQRLAPKVVGAGGEIALIGNADSLDEPTSRVEYAIPEAKPAADAIAAALGIKAIRAGSELGSVDVNVIVGKDLAS